MHGFVASNPREKGFNFASKRGMNFGVIGPRSRRDRALIFVVVDCRLSSDRLGAIPPLKEHDRGSIAPRSRFDRAAIAVRSRCDRGSIGPRSNRSSTCIHYRPMKI